jgi:hypothetical protein
MQTIDVLIAIVLIGLVVRLIAARLVARRGTDDGDSGLDPDDPHYW